MSKTRFLSPLQRSDIFSTSPSPSFLMSPYYTYQGEDAFDHNVGEYDQYDQYYAPQANNGTAAAISASSRAMFPPIITHDTYHAQIPYSHADPPLYPQHQPWFGVPLMSQPTAAPYDTSTPALMEYPSPQSYASSTYGGGDGTLLRANSTSSTHHHRRSPASSISDSPGTADLHNYGLQNPDGTWRCAFPGCSSRANFTRGCDLRKHYKRHSKHLFCRHEDCPQATEGGFSSKKDRTRHEAKHNPGVHCEWDGCQRIFSRVDNMKDHVRRIHRKGMTTMGL